MNQFFKNYFSTLFFIVVLYGFYNLNPYFSWFFQWEYSFFFLEWWYISIPKVFLSLVMAYGILLIPFYIVEKSPSKAHLVLHYFYRKLIVKDPGSIQDNEKTAFLAWWVKWFFAPLMVFWLIGHVFSLGNSLYGAFQNISLFSKDFLVFFNTYFFYTAFSLILFIDVLFFTLGYLLEGKIFKNTIKSVEPTMFGWVVALLCYPPFNSSTSTLLWWYSTDFPTFTNTTIHLTLNIFILILMAIYSWASLSLWLKASNLTNRGIITKGPYRWIRHPAYICKNLAWWIWGLPMLLVALWNGDFKFFLLVMIWLTGWSMLYYLRALTEENHLKQDQTYQAYMQKVPYKFIPKVW